MIVGITSSGVLNTSVGAMHTYARKLYVAGTCIYVLRTWYQIPGAWYTAKRAYFLRTTWDGYHAKCPRGLRVQRSLSLYQVPSYQVLPLVVLVTSKSKHPEHTLPNIYCSTTTTFFEWIVVRVLSHRVYNTLFTTCTYVKT